MAPWQSSYAQTNKQTNIRTHNTHVSNRTHTHIHTYVLFLTQSAAELVMFDGVTAVYRSNVDLLFYIVGSQDENELMLMSVLATFYDAVAILLRFVCTYTCATLPSLVIFSLSHTCAHHKQAHTHTRSSYF